MNRLLGGLGVLAVSLAGVSCGDPTANLRGGAVQVVADPSSVFLTEGAATHIIARVLDEQGNELPDTVTFSTTSSAVTVAYDPTFLVGTDTTTPNATVPSKTRTGIIVTGVSVDLGTITLSSGNLTTTIPFRVLPADPSASFASVVTFSSTTPALGDTVTMSAPGFKFQSGTIVNIGGGGDAVITGISADSNSVSFIPFPGSVGPITVDSTALDILPTVPFTVNLPATITVPALTGTGDPATAPLIAAPATGATVSIFDHSDAPADATCGSLNALFGADIPCYVYKFVVPAGGATYDFTMTWSNTSDQGLYFLDADGTTFEGDACDSNGNGDTAQPEVCSDLTLAAGTYFLAVVGFGPFYAPPEEYPIWTRVDITGK